MGSSTADQFSGPYRYGTPLPAGNDRESLVKFVDDFLKTLIGKIHKNFLKDPYWAEKEKKI